MKIGRSDFLKNSDWCTPNVEASSQTLYRAKIFTLLYFF